MNEWSVYIIKCDGRYLYTGISIDVQRRFGEHISGNGKGSKYTKSFSSIDLVYETVIGNRSLASRIECQIKKLPKQKKELIVLSRFSRDELIEFLGLDK